MSNRDLATYVIEIVLWAIVLTLVIGAVAKLYGVW